MRNLDFRDYFRVYLPKPSLVEQQQIARVLRNIRELIRATYAKLEAARKLKKALVQNLFTRGMSGRPSEVFRTKWFEVPSTWKERRLAAVASVEAGFTMGRDLSGNETVEVPYLTVVNVQEGTLALTEIECVTVKRTELEGLLLRPGDILMTEGGDRDKLGRGGIWRGEIEPCVYQNHIFRVRLMADTYLPELFHFFIQSWHVKKYFYAHAKQTNNLCTINSRELKRLPLFEPSKDEQKEMIAILQAADDEIVAVQTEIEKLNEVRRSLLQNLLTGQARVDGAGLS
jgi:type I restriction enzyme S subunit